MRMVTSELRAGYRPADLLIIYTHRDAAVFNASRYVASADALFYFLDGCSPALQRAWFGRKGVPSRLAHPLVAFCGSGGCATGAVTLAIFMPLRLAA